MSDVADKPRPTGAGRALRDRRFWIGLAVTAICLYVAFRDVSFEAVTRDMAKANLPLLFGVSIPCYVLIVYIRALRWRHLTDAVLPLSRPMLFRATAVGFMANNILPLRIGELVRAWYLARESRGPWASLLGTVLLERVIDAVVVLSLGAAVLGVTGSQAGIGTLAVSAPLVMVLAAPIVFITILRLAPDRAIGFGVWCIRPFLPEGLVTQIEALMRRIAEGLGALRGGLHLFWIVFHSMTVWGIASVIPFWVGLRAMGIELDGPWQVVNAAYVVMIAVGIAVAAPSAPGFFGPYHLACVFALSGFGVSRDPAVALGTLVHATFWVTMTAMGLIALRFGGTSLHDIEEAAGGKASTPDRR